MVDKDDAESKSGVFRCVMGDVRIDIDVARSTLAVFRDDSTGGRIRAPFIHCLYVVG